MTNKLWFEEEETLSEYGINLPSDIANDIAAASLTLHQRKQEPYMPKQPLINAYKTFGDISPDQFAHYQTMAEESGYTLATILTLPEVRDDIEKRGKTLTPDDYDWDSFILSAPKMADLLAREVNRMAIVRDDLDNIKQTEKTFYKSLIPILSEREDTESRPAFSRSARDEKRIHERSRAVGVQTDYGPGKLYKELETTFKHSAASTREGELHARYIAEREGLQTFLLPDVRDVWSHVQGLDIEERYIEWRNYRESIERDSHYVDWYRDKGFFGKLMHGAAHYAGQIYTWQGTKFGQATWMLLSALGLGAAAGVGGAAGALLSPQGVVRDEAIRRASGWAKAYGMLRSIQLSEMSGNYIEMEQERDIYGQGLDPYDMAKWSYIASIAQAPVEYMQLRLAGSMVPVRWFKPTYKTAASASVLASKYLGTPYWKLLTMHAGEGAMNLVNEMAEEFIQGSIGALANRYLRYTSGQPFALSGFAEEFRGPLEEARMAFYSFGLWSMLGVGGRMAETKARVTEFEQNREIFERLNGLSTESKTKQRAPSVYEDNIKDIVDGTPRESVYIPVRRWQRFWQEQGKNPDDVVRELGLETEYRKALDESNTWTPIRDETTEGELINVLDDDGAKMAIPTEIYASKIAGTEWHPGLMQDLAFTETGVTAREVENAKAELEREIDTFTERLDIKAEALRNLQENLRIKLTDVGFSLEEAETVSDLNARMLATVAEHLGEDPKDLLDRLTIIRDENTGEAKVQFSQEGLYQERPAQKNIQYEVNTIQDRVEKGEITEEEGQEEIIHATDANIAPDWSPEFSKTPSTTMDSSFSLGRTLVHGPEINLEVAPDPNNIEATNRWNNLSPDDQYIITRDVTWYAINRVLDNYNKDYKGRILLQFGGYEEFTNPSVALRFDADLAPKGEEVAEIAYALVHVLNQNSVMVTSPEFVPGSFKSSGLEIQHGLTNREEIHNLYIRIRSIMGKDENGNDIVGGHSTSKDGSTLIIVSPEYTEQVLEASKQAINEIYGEDFRATIRVMSDIHVAFIEKESEIYDQSGKNISERLRQDYNDLKRRVSSLVEKGIEKAERGEKEAERTGELRQLRPFYVDEDGNVTLVHFSRVAGLTTIDPSHYGEGYAGREQQRKIEAPEDFVDRSYFALKGGGYFKEKGLGIRRYETKVPLSLLYDPFVDPDGLLAKAKELYGNTGYAFTMFEKSVYDAGYLGLLSTVNGKPVAAVFEPVTVELETEARDKALQYAQSEGFKTPKGDIQFDPDSGEAIIRIFKDGDISTVIHEFTGHFLIEHMLRAEAMGTLSAEGARDLSILRNWVGALENEALTVEQKEQIARGVEAYLMEGKAPTPEVTTVFEKIKRWLLDIYREIRALGVELSDEVRNVFDRWVMLEDEADAVMQRQHLDRIVELAERAGFDTDDVETLANLVEKAIQEQHASLVEEGIKPVVDRLQNTLGDRRKQIRKEVSDIIRSQPVYQMISVLRRPRSRFSLSKQEILDVFGEEGLKVFRHMYKIKDSNLSLSDAVSMFGFANIDEMYNELASAEPIAAVIQRAYQDALGREIQSGAFGDALREIAERATHNDDMLASLVLESLILDARTTKQNMVKAAIKRAQMMRANAKLLIMRDIASKVSPARYFAQEAKYARKYEQAILDGEYEVAVYYKDLQAQNFALAREAIEVREQVRRGMKLVRKHKNRGRKTYGLPIPVLDAISNLVDSVDSRRRTAGELEVRDVLRQYIEERKKLGEEVDLPEDLITSLERKSIDQMTVGEFYNLVDSIKILEHLGKLENRLLEAERQEDFDTTKIKVIEQIASVTTGDGKTVGRLNPNAMQKFIEVMKKYSMSHKRVDFIVKILDDFKDFGPVRDAIFNPLERSTSQEMILQHEAAEKITEIFNTNYPDKVSRQWRKQWLPTSLITGERMNRDNMLAVALNYLNVEGRERLTTGFNLDTETIEAWLNENMTENDWNFVKDVIALLESYWPEVEALMVDVTGLRPKKVEPAGMNTPYGWVSGGYYPIAYDRRLSHHKFFSGVEDESRRVAGVRSMISGYAKERATTVGESAKLMLSVTPVLSKHIADITRDLAFNRQLRDVRRIVNDPEIREAITKAMGDEAVDQIDKWIDHVQTGFPPAVSFFQKLVRKARLGATMVGLGLRFSPAMAQLMGYTSAATHIGPTRVAHAVMDFYSNPLAWNEKIKFVHDKSAFMRFRRQSWDRDVAAAMKRHIEAGTMDRIREAGFYMIGFMDATVTIPVWLEAYNMKVDEVGEQRAIEYADSVIRQTQNVGRAIDLTTAQRGSDFEQILSMFYSYMGTLHNMTYLETQHLMKKGDVARFAAFMLWALIIPGMALSWIRQGGPEEPDPWEDESAWWVWAKWATRITLGYYAGTWIGIRDITGFLSGYDMYQFSPIVAGFREAQDLVKSTWKMFEEDDKSLPEKAQKLTKATYEFTEFWWRLPTKGLRQNFAYFMDYIMSDEYNKEFDWRRFLFNTQKK